MLASNPPTGTDQELTQAIDELTAALARASAAAAAIQGIVPRLAATGSVLDEIAALLRAERPALAVSPERPALPSDASARPTLVVTSASPPRPRTPARRRPEPTWEPEAAALSPLDDRASIGDESPADAVVITDAAPGAHAPIDAALTCFRLQFESVGGPLDLRAIDDAVTGHHAVRDVALLDYDGRRATLKVWIVAPSSPADVQSELDSSLRQAFAPEREVRIVALEDVA